MFKTLTSIKPRTIARFAALLACIAAPASARNTDSVTYTVVAGDTLYSIAERYLKTIGNARDIQRINRVRNPRRLSIDRTLTIPREMLKFERVQLMVGPFSGPVTVGGELPETGANLALGDQVVTQRNGFIRFESTFGGRVSLPSNTTARLVRARRYLLGNTLDVEFEVLNGRANAVSPTLEGQDRLRMRTPVAVTAVRGTEFRVAYDAANADVSLTEVTEGTVQVAAGGETRPTPAGFGVSSNPSGVNEPEALLPEPAFVEGTAVQTGETLTFAFEPVTGAQAYRVRIAKDPSGLDVLADQIVSGGVAEFPSIDNARYFVSARSISPSGLEGASLSSDSFLRKRVGVTPSQGQSPDYDGYNFTWTGEGEGTATYAFQLWSEGSPEVLLVDEVGLTQTQIIVTNLAPGRYNWRVAATETDEVEGLIKVWDETRLVTASN